MKDKPDLGALFGAKSAETFLGLDACTDLNTLDAPMAIVGVPCASPYRSVGAYCRNAPNALRQAISSLSASRAHHDFDIGGAIFPEERLKAVDCGDLPYDENDAPGNRKIIREAIGTILGKGAVPIVIGGDDSVPIPMLQAFAGAGKYTILQLDAHIDWKDEHMGERMGLSSTMRRASEMEHIERIIQVGARGAGSASSSDYRDALDWGVKFVTAYELHRDGVASVIKLIPEGSTVILCIDIDALDPSIAPGVIGRAPGGLTYYQAVDLIKSTAQRGPIAAIDFVEFMPERDVDELGALTTARLIVTALGVIARQAAKQV